MSIKVKPTTAPKSIPASASSTTTMSNKVIISIINHMWKYEPTANACYLG